VKRYVIASLCHIDVRFANSLKEQLHIVSLGHIDVRFASSLKQQLHIACDLVKRYAIVVLVS
jgi:hypothetical protein